MPLLTLSSAEAMRRARNAQARWPRTAEAQADRLMPLAQPRFTPSFRISKDEPIFTVGSCFARNIEKQLIVEGYNVAAAKFEPPADLGFNADPDALLNRYVAHSISNELRWALGHGKPFRDRYYVNCGKAGWFDPHLHPAIRPAPLEVVQARREAVQRYMAMAAQARVFIMTLGMAEAWYDTQTGLYLNGVLPSQGRERDPGRFEFHVLDYNQIVEQLEFIRNVLKFRGREDVRMLVTVSPVAMNTTFTGGEVLTANTYSKAVQRAAVEAFVAAHPDVDYFPSFESVMLSDRRRAWRRDQAHASDEIVRLNVLRMIEAYSAAPEADEDRPPLGHEAVSAGFSFVQAARDASESGDVEAAAKAFREAVRLAPGEHLIHLEYGRFLIDQGQYEEARRRLKESLRLGSAGYGGYYHLARALRGLGRLEDALWIAGRARQYQPNRPGLLAMCADIAERLGRPDEAIDYARRCLELEPESEQFRRLLERLERLNRRGRLSVLRDVLPRRRRARAGE
jgi:tetratricopeptide (TPR) repeat protein